MDEFAQACVDWDIKNHKAMSTIISSLFKEVSLDMQTLELVSDMSMKLVDLFEWDSTIWAITLLGQPFTIKFKAKSMMQSFLMWVKVIHN